MVDAGLEAIGLELGRGERAAIDGHVRLLLAWTRAINLTAIRDPAAAARLHVLDSLAAVPLLRGLGAGELLDLGSGGGFPGLPLAVALPARATLLEATGKKARFLETAVAALGLGDRVDVVAERAEELARTTAHAGRWPVVTARAVAPLGRLVGWALPLLAPGGALVAWKRMPIDDEVANAAGAIRAAGGAGPDIASVAVPGLEEHRLVVVRRR